MFAIDYKKVILVLALIGFIIGYFASIKYGTKTGIIVGLIVVIAIPAILIGSHKLRQSNTGMMPPNNNNQIN